MVDDDIAPTGATTDIDYTVLVFLLATGQAMMCAVMFMYRTDRDISEILISWKLGIDIMKPMNGDTTSELIKENGNRPMSGGPKGKYNGKEVPCFFSTPHSYMASS